MMWRAERHSGLITVNAMMAAAGQKEMLLSIDGKKPAKEAATKKSTARSQRKSA
jgi:DNA end-binding protein Ku